MGARAAALPRARAALACGLGRDTAHSEPVASQRESNGQTRAGNEEERQAEAWGRGDCGGGRAQGKGGARGAGAPAGGLLASSATRQVPVSGRKRTDAVSAETVDVGNPHASLFW